jgi:glycosyltransferase involved in cell wall biosynthesis
MEKMLQGCAEHIFLLQGGRSTKERDAIRSAMQSVPANESVLLIAIGQYIGEGFNFPRLDTLMLATPIAWEGNVEQYAGRLHRAYAGKTEIVPCAWQHVKRYKESCDWQERYPYLKEKQFFFSLATLAKNKNGKWIIEAAGNNPEAVFAVAGKHYETEYTDIPDNVHLLGYISDEDACALIRHCKAFIFPSLYEGFGLPPIEALALGADVISSDTTSLPEVLSDSVHYIDPYNADIDIEKLMEEPVGDRSHALDQFSWERSAELLLKMLRDE